MSDGVITLLGMLLGGGLFAAIGNGIRDRKTLQKDYVQMVRDDLTTLRDQNAALEKRNDELEARQHRLERALGDAGIAIPD